MVSIPPPSLTRRRLLAGLGLGAGAVGMPGLLAGCGGGSTGLDGGAQPPGGGGKPSLDVWYHQYGETGTQQAVERYAKEYPDATVKVQWTPGDYASKVNSGLLSNSGPDVFEGTPTLSQVKAGQLVPLDDLIEPVKSDYTEADLTSVRVEGKLYGARIVDDTVLLYYRKSVLEQAGVNPPTTLEELVNVAREIHTPDQAGLYIGNDAGVTPTFGGGSMLGPVLWSVGQNVLTPDNQPGFLGDNVIAAFSMIKQLVDDKSILLGAPTEFWDPSSFTQGLASMQWTGLWAMPAIQKALGDDFGIVPFPAFSASLGQPSVPQGGWSAMVSAKGDVEAAKAYVKWLWIDNAAFQEDFNLSYGFHIPPRRSLAAKAAKLQEGPAAEAVRLYNEYAIAGNTTWNTAMNNAFGDAATAIVRKGQDPQAALDTAAKAVNQQLDQLLG